MTTTAVAIAGIAGTTTLGVVAQSVAVWRQRRSERAERLADLRAAADDAMGSVRRGLQIFDEVRAAAQRRSGGDPAVDRFLESLRRVQDREDQLVVRLGPRDEAFSAFERTSLALAFTVNDLSLVVRGEGHSEHWRRLRERRDEVVEHAADFTHLISERVGVPARVPLRPLRSSRTRRHGRLGEGERDALRRRRRLLGLLPMHELDALRDR